jgi:CubicO group peptidase (beta-lactamase class C family)
MQSLLRPELRSRLPLHGSQLRLRPLATAAFLIGTWGLAAAAPTPAALADAAGEKAWLAHGFTAAQRDSLREVWRWGMAERFVPGGAMLIVHRGETVFREAFGVADLATGRPFTVDAPCRLASVTKPFTATLFARLVEAGWLAWDDPVDKFLPEFAKLEVRGQGRAKRAPLVRELLSHTAGFAGNDERRSGAVEISPGSTLAEVAATLAQAGLVREPGSGYAYSGFGYMVAGRVAEVATGREFSALMHEQLGEPIGAGRAVFHSSAAADLLARMPVMYDRIGGSLVPVAAAGREDAAVRFPNPGGGLVATLDDVGRLLRLHRDRGVAADTSLLLPASLRALYVRQAATNREGYGLGFNLLHAGADGVADRVQHGGASGTLALIDFQRDVFVVVLTQVPTKQRLPFGKRLSQAIDSIFPPP